MLKDAILKVKVLGKSLGEWLRDRTRKTVSCESKRSVP